jgi:hypothetical protein
MASICLRIRHIGLFRRPNRNAKPISLSGLRWNGIGCRTTGRVLSLFGIYFGADKIDPVAPFEGCNDQTARHPATVLEEYIEVRRQSMPYYGSALTQPHTSPRGTPVATSWCNDRTTGAVNDTRWAPTCPNCLPPFYQPGRNSPFSTSFYQQKREPASRLTP